MFDRHMGESNLHADGMNFILDGRDRGIGARIVADLPATVSGQSYVE